MTAPSPNSILLRTIAREYISDYQSVTINAIEETTITIEVTEVGDSRALASLFDEGAEKEDWLKIGAMLLLGEKAMNGDIPMPDDLAEPEHFVTNVTKVEATPIGEGNANNTLYRAVLRIELADAEYAEVFEVGESFGAVADLGGDFEDIFG